MAPRQIDSRVVAHGHNKLYLWIIWLVIMVVSAGYAALSFISFQKILRVYRRDQNGVESNVLWSVLTASFIGPASVVAFFVFGTLILLRKTMAETGLSYTYGALHLSSFWIAIVSLMSAISLHGQKDLIETCWEDASVVATNNDVCGAVSTTLPWASSDTTLITATYVFAYILVFGYFVLFVVLALLRDAAKKLDIAQSVEAAAAQEGVAASDEPVSKPAKGGKASKKDKKDKKTKLIVKPNEKDGEPVPSGPLSSLSGAEDAEPAKETTLPAV